MSSIAVIGSGAVGSYYGGLLARAGHDVRFLMRRDLEAVRKHGLFVESKNGDFHLANVQAFADAGDIGEVEWVICSLKATALQDAEALVRPCAGPDTRIVALMNGLGIEDQFAGWFRGDRVFGAMAFVCINRGEPGVVRHLDYGRVSIGHYRDDPNETEKLRELFVSGDIETVIAPNLLYARWEKLGWNIPFSGLSVAAGGIHTRAILDTPELCDIVRAAIDEVVAAANADLAKAGSDSRMDAADLADRMFSQTETMGEYRPSMLIDYLLGRPLEADAILGEPCRKANALGVPTPTIAAIYGIAKAAELRNRGAMRALEPREVAFE